MSAEKIFPTLYTTSKHGKQKQWDIKVETRGTQVFIVKTSGYVGGKLTSTEKEVTQGKNLGKKNETSKFEQACMEAQSTWTKHERANASESEEPGVAEQTKFLPMLASDASKVNDKYLLASMMCQPKLDGIRMTVTLRDNEVVCISRTGLEVNVPHIANACKPYMFPGIYLDGELYSEDIPFEELSGLFRAQDRDEELFSSATQFWIFDMYDENQPNLTFEQRWERLQEFRYIRPLQLVPTIPVSRDSLEDQLTRYTNQGYEGLILRDPKSVYEVGSRSLKLLKWKPFQDSEFEITGAFGGQGTELGCVIWKCKTSRGREFHVRPKGSFALRKEQLAQANKYIGKMLTVKYQNLSAEGVPRFPIGVSIRAD